MKEDKDREDMEQPEHLAVYIGIASELSQLKEAGAIFPLESLSEGCWCCLVGANEGFARAMAEKSKPKEE